MGKYGGELSYTRGSGGASIAAQLSRQVSSYAASGARATATRAAKQEADRALDAARYLKAARAGQVTVFTREPARDTAAYQAKQMILTAQKQAEQERIAAAKAKEAAEAKAAEEARLAAIAAEQERIEEETGRIIGTACPKGNRYAPTGFEKCFAGYHEVWEGWFPTRNRYCDCDVTPPAPEDKKGVKDVLDALTKGEININSIILAAAVVMLIISLIKR